MALEIMKHMEYAHGKENREKLYKKWCFNFHFPLQSTVGTLCFDTVSSNASVAEGENATVCITISSSTATSLGCDLTVTLTTADLTAISKL